MPGPDWATRRRDFLDEQRRSGQERYDRQLAATYDRDWGVISASHARFVGRLLELTRPAGTLLDAPCGTGKYWPLILAAGRTVVGVDQSAGMLEVARAKHPQVPAARVALHELAFVALFDAVMCVDALEFVGPEDWPETLRRLATAARPGAPLYLTVEMADAVTLRSAYQAALEAGHPVVPGEDFDGTGYHHHPAREAVLGWLSEAGLTIVDETEGHEYWHVLARRGRESGPRPTLPDPKPGLRAPGTGRHGAS